MTVTDWSLATLTDELIALIILLVFEHYEVHGDKPSVRDIRAKLMHPGS